MSNLNIRNAVRFALTAGVAASFVNAPVAFAEDDDATKLDRVEVTGSRIKRTQLEGAMPVTAISREDIEKTGISSIGDLLQELPSAGAALNTNFNNGGDGSTRVDLRNLGSNRVLVLVNGRRWINAVGGGGVNGSVDLNTIPLSVIERIEVLKDGASAVYGSDAIAGVINIITRKDYDGASANATIGEFDEGDGRQELYDFSVGSSGSRSSAFFNASYYKADPVWAGDRNISFEPLWGTGAAFGSSTTPDGRFRFDAQFNSAGAPINGQPCITTGIPAFWCGTVANVFPSPGVFGATHIGPPTGSGPGAATPNDGTDLTQYAAMTSLYNFAPENYLGTPQQRWSLYAQGRYDVTDNVTFTTEALYNKRKSEQLLAAMPVVLTAGGSQADGQFIPIAVDNAYNPLGYAMIDTSQTGAFDPITNPVYGARNLARRFVETGGRSFNQNVDTYRFGAGFEGNFEAIGRVWDWNVNYTYTESQAMDITYGLLNTANLRNSLAGPTVCTGGCVELNFFGGEGSITPAMLDYLTFNAHDDQGYVVRNYSANLSGEIFDLPAGPLGLAMGFEYRQEEGFDDPDALIAAGNTTGNARTPTGGGFSLNEFYAEFAVPVLKDAPLAEDLEVSVAFRSSDYDIFGSTTNAKFGVRWQPFSDLLVRATFQEGFRAPNIGELFQGQSDSFPTWGDPCSVGNSGILDPTPDTADEEQLYANCTNTPSPNTSGEGVATTTLVNQLGGREIFVPAGPFYTQSNTQIRITVGGNQDLDPETSESVTFGFVYSPSYVEGLSLSLDFYDIEIKNAITTRGPGTISSSCYTGGSGGLDPNGYGTGVQADCNLITRFASGDIEDLSAITENVASFKTSGIDLNVVYRAGELPFIPGEWKFTWDTTFLDDFEVCTRGAGCFDFVQFNTGDGSIPAFKSNLDIDWSWGDWEATWRMRFIGRQYEACTSFAAFYGFPCSTPATTPSGSFSGTGTNALGATTYHSVQVSYNISDWDTRVTFGIQNVGDKAPPLSAAAFANSFDPTTYEVPGRFPYLRISKQF